MASQEKDPLGLMSVEALKAMRAAADAEANKLELHALNFVDRLVQAARARRQRGEPEDLGSDTVVLSLQHLIVDEPESAWSEAAEFRALSARISNEIESRSQPVSRGFK